MDKRTRGFTLIELLVVIGIIAVLISILLPTLNKARDAAKTVQCMSQLRQFGQITQNYAALNKGYLFPCWYDSVPGVVGSTSISLPDILNQANLLKKAGNGGQISMLWQCPTAITFTGQGLLTYCANQSVHVHYQYNGVTQLPDHLQRKLQQIHRSSEVFSLSDASQSSAAFTSTGVCVYSSDFQSDGSTEIGMPLPGASTTHASPAAQRKPADSFSGWYNQLDGTGSNYKVRYRHGQMKRGYVYTDGTTTVTYSGMVGLCNYLFCDGHVESFTPGQLKAKNVATWY